MDEGGTVKQLSKKELRKQKLMEYLESKGKLKPPNPKSYLRDDRLVRKPAMSTMKVHATTGKENQAPGPVNMTNEGAKVRHQAAKTTSNLTGTLYCVSYKQNVQRSGVIPPVADLPLAPAGSTLPPRLSQKLVPTGTYTVTSRKSKLGAASQPRKQPGIEAKHATRPSSGKTLSNEVHAIASQRNSRPNSGSRAAKTGPSSTNSARMSLGPVAKTKTGLIPAVTQPRDTKSNLTTVRAAPTATSTNTNANRIRCSTAVSVLGSQRSAVVQRKTHPATAVTTHAKRTTAPQTASAEVTVQAPSKVSSKPFPVKTLQPSRHNQCSRPTGTAKADDKEKVMKAKPVQLLNKTAAQRSEVKGARDAQTRRVGSSKVPPPLAGTKKAGVLSVPRTVPRSAKYVSQAGWTTDTKTPKAQGRAVPQTEVKKVTAAQEERMKKLHEWREARGISYKRPPMPVRPRVRHSVALPQPYWATMEEEDNAHSLICAVDRSLADCLKLLGEGCPPEQVTGVLSRLPAVAKKFAKYWICQARLMEHQGNLDVLPMFEEAVRIVLEPVDDLRTVVFEILKKKESQGPSSFSVAVRTEEETPAQGESSPEATEDPGVTPRPVRALIRGDRGASSVVKYKITATPGGPRSQQREPVRVNGQEVRFFTPVRRSVRIERASLRYPASLHDQDQCVASYNDLMAEEEDKERERDGGEEGRAAVTPVHSATMYIYRENNALKDQVQVQLVYGDD
ncbi:cytoskeleton-associated protein 2-like [Polymixia lowei]